jgi:hypothetical protein
MVHKLYTGICRYTDYCAGIQVKKGGDKLKTYNGTRAANFCINIIFKSGNVFFQFSNSPLKPKTRHNIS